MKEEIEIVSPDSELGGNLQGMWELNVAGIPPLAGVRNDLLQHVSPLQSNHLLRTNTNNYGVLKYSKNDPYFHSLTDFSTIETRVLSYQKILSQNRTPAFFGTGIGEVFMAIQEGIVSKTDKFPFLIIEPDITLFHAVLYFTNISSFLASYSHCFFIGDQWQKNFVTAFNNYDDIIIIQAPQRRLEPEIEAFQHQLKERQINSTLFQDSLHCKRHGKRVALGSNASLPLAQCYADNLALLSDYSHFRAPVHFEETLTNIELYVEVSSDGQIFFDVGQLNNTTPQYITLSPPNGESLTLDNLVNNTWLLLGAGDGKLLTTLFLQTIFKGQWAGYSQILYLIEPNTVLFCIFLHFFNLKDLLGDNRLRFFIGEDCCEVFTTYLEENHDARIPDRFLHCSHYEHEVLDQYITITSTLNREIADEIAQLSNDLTAFYNSKDISYWQKRYNEKTQLSIVALSTRMSSFVQYCARDLIDGFQKNGHETELLIEKDGLSSLQYREVLRRLIELKPDLIIVIGHFRQEFSWLPEKLPFMCWIQDMLPSVLHFQGFTLGYWDFPYSINKSWAKGLQTSNAAFSQTEIKVLPVGFNEKYFYPLLDIDKKYDISYISHLFDIENTFEFTRNENSKLRLLPYEHDLIHTNQLTSDELLNYYSIIADGIDRMRLSELTNLVTNTSRAATALCQSVSKRSGIIIPEFLITHFSGGHTRLFYDVMNQIKFRPLLLLHNDSFSVAAWGNNWSQYPELSIFSKGIAENSKQVNRIHNQSRINLNNSGGVSFHMKAIEIMASNSFMLSRKITLDGHPLTDYFKPETEVVFFHNEDELPKTADYFLTHPQLCKTIAQKAYKKVSQLFSYSNHATTIMSDISSRLHSPHKQHNLTP